MRKILLIILAYFLLTAIAEAKNPKESTPQNVIIKDASGNSLALEDDNMPVKIQDQATAPIDIRMNFILNDTVTVATQPTTNQYDLEVSASHGLIAGDKIGIIEQNGAPRLYQGKILSVSVNTLTLDTPINYPYLVGDTVLEISEALNINGSVTTQVASITNFYTEDVDITRFIIHITDDSAMDDSLFGGITALTRGIVLRKNEGNNVFTNYWNVKTNGEFGELAYDKTYDDKAPAGLFGLTIRLTYAGQDKHGVVIRLQPGESIEMLIQDNLTGLESFNCTVEGHFTEN